MLPFASLVAKSGACTTSLTRLRPMISLDSAGSLSDERRLELIAVKDIDLHPGRPLLNVFKKEVQRICSQGENDASQRALVSFTLLLPHRHGLKDISHLVSMND